MTNPSWRDPGRADADHRRRGPERRGCVLGQASPLARPPGARSSSARSASTTPRRTGDAPWARRAIYAGLAYFIMPIDLIPDWCPSVGYTDDAATLLMTLAFVSVYVGKDIKIRAAAKTADWFGEA
jgi:hypothetical protein